MEEQTTQVSSDGSWSYVSNDGLQVKVNADGSWTKTGIMGEETAVSADGSWTHKARIEIAEQGTHNELLERKGLYAGMWDNFQKGIEWKV